MNDFSKQAAKASWVIPLLNLGLMALGTPVLKSSASPAGSQIFGLIVILMFLAGIVFGIVGLSGAKKHGAKGIILPAITGICLNAILLYLLLSIAAQAFQRAKIAF